METVQNFIHGQICESNSQRFAAIYNPATGEQTRQAALSTAAETADAIAAAQKSVPGMGENVPFKTGTGDVQF
ncbi:hypothetical protein P4S72_20260 [Vibrio sp. PP-XX7]